MVPRLVLVPTPIGAMRDVTLRALDTLRAADVVAAEDTRHTRGLLHHHGIDTPLVRLDAHTIATRGRQVLTSHDLVAYVSDAGTPGISDPGADLLHLALTLGHDVEVLPGPTAFVPAVVLADMGTARFTFEGFLPRAGGARTRRLTALARHDHPSIVYESPRRLVATLADLAAACGADRSGAVSRELTKIHEETVRDDLAGLHRYFLDHPPRGECVIVVGGCSVPDEPRTALGVAGATGGGAGTMVTVSAKDAADILARAGLHGRTLREVLSSLGVPRNEAYAWATHAATGDDEA